MQIASIPVALTNRLRPKSRAAMCIAIAITKYAISAAQVTAARYGIQSPAIRPAAAANLITGISHHRRRGQRTASKHSAMNRTGFTHSRPSPNWMNARTSTGHTGSGV